MPKYKVTRYSEIQEIWYMKAPDEDAALEIAAMNEPDEMFPVGNSDTDIEIDDSLDEAEENNLKERKWNNEIT